MDFETNRTDKFQIKHVKPIGKGKRGRDDYR